MTFLKILLLSAFTFATACADNNVNNIWHGEYHYSLAGGETVGGSQITMDITLKLNKENAGIKCLLSADGFQTFDRIICTTAMNKNKLAVQFKSYEDGKTTNEIGVERYKPGETLFTLENTTDKNITNQHQYLVHWAAYSPFGDEQKIEKDYFEKNK